MQRIHFVVKWNLLLPSLKTKTHFKKRFWNQKQPTQPTMPCRPSFFFWSRPWWSFFVTDGPQELLGLVVKVGGSFSDFRGSKVWNPPSTHWLRMEQGKQPKGEFTYAVLKVRTRTKLGGHSDFLGSNSKDPYSLCLKCICIVLMCTCICSMRSYTYIIVHIDQYPKAYF